jgi:hypothetical protein
MRQAFHIALLVSTLLLSGCSALEYGLILNNHRGDLMSLRTESGKRFFDVYWDQLLARPLDKSALRKHFKEHGFPDYIYCEGQLSNYLIYMRQKEKLQVFHFKNSIIGTIEIKPIEENALPNNARAQLASIIEVQKRQLERQELEELEERWKNEYLLELLE